MKPKLMMVIIGILEIVIHSGMFDFVASGCPPNVFVLIQRIFYT